MVLEVICAEGELRQENIWREKGKKDMGSFYRSLWNLIIRRATPKERKAAFERGDDGLRCGIVVRG